MSIEMDTPSAGVVSPSSLPTLNDCFGVAAMFGVPLEATSCLGQLRSLSHDRYQLLSHYASSTR